MTQPTDIIPTATPGVAATAMGGKDAGERPMLAMALRLVSAFLISIMFVTVKIVADRGVHIVESLFYRQFIACPMILGWAAWNGGIASLKTDKIGLHISRTAIGCTGMVLNFGSFILLPVAEATAIGFMVPIFGTVLSALLLREVTGWHRWAAVIVGLVGVLVIIRPGAGLNLPPLGLAVALAAAVVTSFIAILLRTLGKTEGATTTVFYFTALSVPPLGLLMLFFARAHDPATWGLLVLLGITGGLAQLCMTGALKFGPVSIVLPMDYSVIIWMTLIGWELFAEWPGSATWIGAVLIAGSGLYIAWREHVRSRAV